MNFFVPSIFSETIYAIYTVETQPHPCIKIENHTTLFMVNMASSVDRMRVRPTMTTLHNMGAILQLKLSHAA